MRKLGRIGDTIFMLKLQGVSVMGTEHPHTLHFRVFHSTHFNVARDIGSRCLSASRRPCFTRSVCSDLSSTLHVALFTVSLIFLFILLFFIFHVGWFDEKSHVYFRE